MGVDDIMRERGQGFNDDVRSLPASAGDSPNAPSPDAAEETNAEEPATNDDSDLPTPSNKPFEAIEERVDLKLSLDDAGNVAAALSLVAKLFG